MFDLHDADMKKSDFAVFNENFWSNLEREKNSNVSHPKRIICFLFPRKKFFLASGEKHDAYYSLKVK
jgi:hypothetical protein